MFPHALDVTHISVASDIAREKGWCTLDFPSHSLTWSPADSYKQKEFARFRVGTKMITKQEFGTAWNR